MRIFLGVASSNSTKSKSWRSKMNTACNRPRRIILMGSVLGVAFFLGSLLEIPLNGLLGARSDRREAQAQLQIPSSFAELAAAAKPSVVNISTTRVVRMGERAMPPFSREQFGRGPQQRGEHEGAGLGHSSRSSKQAMDGSRRRQVGRRRR